MSVKAMSWAWEMSNLEIYEKMVLLRLADHANSDGFCWPGKESLAGSCCCSKRKVDMAILSLQAKGLIKIEDRSSGGRAISNVYHLQLDQLPLFEPANTINPAQRAGMHSVQGCTAEQETLHSTTKNPAQRAPESKYNHKRTVERAGARATAVGDEERFDYSNWQPDEPCLNRIRMSDPGITPQFLESQRLDFISFAEDSKVPERLLRSRFQSQVHRNWIKTQRGETNTGPLQKAIPADLRNVPDDRLEAWARARDGPRPGIGETYDEYRNRIAQHLKNRESDGTTSYLQSAAASLAVN